MPLSETYTCADAAGVAETYTCADSAGVAETYACAGAAGVVETYTCASAADGVAAPSVGPGLANAVGWYMRNTGITLMSGDVEQWADQSGQGNHLTFDGGSTTRPAVSGSGDIDLQEASDGLQATAALRDLLDTGLFTIGVRVYITSSNPRAAIFGTRNANDDSGGLLFSAGSATQVRGYVGDNQNDGANFTADEWATWIMAADGAGGMSIYLNGVEVDSDTGATPQCTTIPSVGKNLATNTDSGVLLVAEILVYSDEKTGGDLATLNTYLTGTAT